MLLFQLTILTLLLYHINNAIICPSSLLRGVVEKKIKKIVEAFVRVGTQKSPSAAQLDAER